MIIFSPATEEEMIEKRMKQGEIVAYNAVREAFSDPALEGHCVAEWAIPGTVNEHIDMLFFSPEWRLWVFEVKGCFINQIVRIDYGRDFIMTADYYGESIENGTKKDAGSPLAQIRGYKNIIKDPLGRTGNHSQYHKQFFFYMQDAVLLPFITRAEWNSRGFDQYSELTDKIIFKDQLNTPASLKSEMSRLMAKQFTAEALKDTFNQLAIAIIQHSRLDDVPPAPNWYSKNSSMGSDKIQMMVSHSVETNSEVPPADKESLLCKAEEGDPQAQYDYAWFNVKGAPWDEPDQFKEYLHWIEKAAENGSPEAQFELAMHLFKAEYIPEDQERALFLMKNAADATEDDEFQYRYGAMHILAHEKYRNTTVAAEYFKLAIAQGEVKSMYELAQLYLKGDGVNKNIPLGFKLLEKAARKGYVAAIKELAIRHDEGNETPKNMEEAEKWYRAAAVQGDTDCMYNLAFIYRKKGDLKSASEWFQKAADHGHRDAQIKTAISYRNGDSGLILDHYKAIEYFRMAADQGEDFALLKIADYYAEGLWIKKDIKESLRLYTMSAQLNNHIAQFLLYSIYKDGEFGVKDEFESLRWLKKAAENGYYLAKICLGNYYKELGSEEKAFQCFKEAAESGDDLAQYELACCYLDGYGTSRNKKEAMRLMRLAAEGGSDEAVSFLKENKPKTIISKFYSAFS